MGPDAARENVKRDTAMPWGTGRDKPLYHESLCLSLVFVPHVEIRVSSLFGITTSFAPPDKILRVFSELSPSGPLIISFVVNRT